MDKIGYVCIYSRTPEEAAQNVLRLIVGGQCGFDEGAEAWRAEIHEWLEGGADLRPLNNCGASLTVAQWRAALERVVAGLDAELGG
ncbi:MAG TPA: hypothetical protein VKT77_16245 [Chthonomonadaceae bacterium]|nr:hypothetical protein [Chthonomonadaceae bacterium]